jgi:ABC-type multidrug transport system ATPase subunit
MTSFGTLLCYIITELVLLAVCIFFLLFLLSGKSTTISILSGTLLATAGKQYVAGCDLRVDPNLIHKYVGICPQFDVVWHDLTVAEHLSFQARQRGVPSGRLTAEVQKAALAVGLDGECQCLPRPSCMGRVE